MTKLRVYQIALVLSLILNALMMTGFWLYIHFAALFETVETVTGFVN